MKISLSFKFLFLVLLLSQNIKQSYQQLPDGEDVPKNYHQLDLLQVTGPESIAFDCKNQGPYVGVSDGRILKWHGPRLGWKEFAIPSPVRPLGLKFNYATCDLYIADACFGLLVVGPNGGVAQQLATSAEGVPFRFTNGLDIDSTTGVVYFTDSSIFFQRRDLAFSNDVTLDADNSYLLVAESDIIQRNKNGEFWVGLISGRSGRIQNDAYTKLPDPVGVKFDQEGKILKHI
ncbi:hypothetical protein POUND7_014918 [Theobroma cacao]